MSHFCEMDWTPRWDWENFAGFGSKAESPKKPQLLDWMIVDDGGETNGGSFNLSSDGGHVSSAKSSLSASTDSSVKDGLQTPNFKLMTSEAFSGNFSKKMVNSGSSPYMKASVDSVEPLIGLKLGKRTYFENNGAVESFTVMPTPSTTSSLKRTKSSGQNISVPRCVVEGCNVDLTTAKEYHRRHRVCDGHSKCPKVIVGGLERRFCQQCSRFHSLSEFDEKKRSCRRRLSDHNARRRKPQRETIQFSSGRLSSPFYGERKKLSFLFNNSPLIHSKYSADTTWDDSTCNSKFTLTKEYPLKSTSGGGLMHMPGTKLPAPHVNNTHGNAVLFASKSNIPEVFNPGSKGSLISSHLDASPDYGRALSLLSKNTWDPCGPENGITQPMIHNAIPEGVPLPSSDFWLHQPSAHPRFQSFLSNSNYQEIQLLVTPYEADLYSNILN